VSTKPAAGQLGQLSLCSVGLLFAGPTHGALGWRVGAALHSPLTVTAFA